MNIKDYWQQPPKEQKKVLTAVAKAEQVVYAKEHQLVFYRGNLIKPEDYPCKCELENPAQCWEDKHPNAYDWQAGGVCQCRCRCHTYYEAF